MSCLPVSGWTSTITSIILQPKKVGLTTSCQPDIAPISCSFLYRYATVASSALRRVAMALRDVLTWTLEGATALSCTRARNILISSSSTAVCLKIQTAPSYLSIPSLLTEPFRLGFKCAPARVKTGVQEMAQRALNGYRMGVSAVSAALAISAVLGV